MGEKRITVYESDNEALSNGRLYNQAKGYAYIDEDNKEITITSHPGDYAKVVDRIPIDVENKEPSAPFAENGVDVGNLVGYGLMALAALLFIFAIPMTWKNLFRDFGEFPLECSFWVITAIISLVISTFKGFKAGIVTAAAVGSVFEMIYNHEIGWAYFTVFPIMFAGFGVIPSGIGFLIKKIKDRKR